MGTIEEYLESLAKTESMGRLFAENKISQIWQMIPNAKEEFRRSEITKENLTEEEKDFFFFRFEHELKSLENILPKCNVEVLQHVNLLLSEMIYKIMVIS